jgi:hypothetical protein
VSRGTSTAEAPPVERSAAARHWDRARIALLVVALGLVAAVFVTGEAPGAWSGPQPGYGELLGWRVPPEVQVGWVVTWFLTVLLLVAAPRTWWATPFGWFWVMLLTVPVGALAFLLLAGPTPGLPARRATAWRLPGLWAFVICLALAVASGRFG